MLFVLTACKARVEPFPDFDGIRRVIVVTTLNDTVAVVTDSVRIRQLVRFANERNGDWRDEWLGNPIPQINLFFYGAEFQGSFGAGENFFSSQRLGMWATRLASVAEVAQLCEELQLPHDCAAPGAKPPG